MLHTLTPVKANATWFQIIWLKAVDQCENSGSHAVSFLLHIVLDGFTTAFWHCMQSVWLQPFNLTQVRDRRDFHDRQSLSSTLLLLSSPSFRLLFCVVSSNALFSKLHSMSLGVVNLGGKVRKYPSLVGAQVSGSFVMYFSGVVKDLQNRVDHLSSYYAAKEALFYTNFSVRSEWVLGATRILIGLRLATLEACIISNASLIWVTANNNVTTVVRIVGLFPPIFFNVFVRADR